MKAKTMLRHHNPIGTQDALVDAAGIQQETLASVQRMQAQAAQSEDVGNLTLEQLERQRAKIDATMVEGDRLHQNLDATEKLQNRLSRWALRFNRGRAVRESKFERDQEKRKKDNAEKRTARMNEPLKGAKNDLTPVTITKKKNGRVRKNRKEEKENDRTVEHRKDGVTFGVSSEGGEYDDEIHHLAQTDKGIDEGLDAVGSQLDRLLHMSNTIESEVTSQNKGIDAMQEQMEEAHLKQKIINKRSRRFLDRGSRARREASAIDKLGSNSSF